MFPNPLSLDSAQLWPSQRNSEADWFARYGLYRPAVFYSHPIFSHEFQLGGLEVEGAGGGVVTESGKCGLGVISLRFRFIPSSDDRAFYLPTTAEPLLFSCFGEEHPGVGPLYGEELLLVEVGLCSRDRESGRGVSDGVVRASRSRSGGRRAAEGGNGNASGNPVM